MLVSYNSQLIQEICFQTPVAIEYLGEDLITVLQSRLSDLDAANNIYELPVGKVEVVKNICTFKSGDALLIRMTPNYPNIKDNNLLYDWSTVERIKIMGINDVI